MDTKIAARIFFALMVTVSSLSAESYTTTWNFTTRNVKTNLITSYRPSEESSVIMPFGSRWNCKKLKVFVRGDGDYMGEFFCTNDNEESIMIPAICKPGKEDTDIGTAVLYAGKIGIQLTISCRTTVASEVF